MTKQLVVSTESSYHSNYNPVNNNVIGSNNKNPSMSRDFTGHSNSAEKSALNDGISEPGISKQHSVKVSKSNF